MSHTALVVESMINEVLSEWNEEFDEKEMIPDFYGAQGQGLNDYSYNPPLSKYRWGVGNNIDQEPAAVQALRSSTGIDMDQGISSLLNFRFLFHLSTYNMHSLTFFFFSYFFLFFSSCIYGRFLTWR